MRNVVTMVIVGILALSCSMRVTAADGRKFTDVTESPDWDRGWQLYGEGERLYRQKKWDEAAAKFRTCLIHDDKVRVVRQDMLRHYVFALRRAKDQTGLEDALKRLAADRASGMNISYYYEMRRVYLNIGTPPGYNWMADAQLMEEVSKRLKDAGLEIMSKPDKRPGSAQFALKLTVTDKPTRTYTVDTDIFRFDYPNAGPEGVHTIRQPLNSTAQIRGIILMTIDDFIEKVQEFNVQ